MIDLREIRETIEELKCSGTTIGAAEKLAMLYIVEERLERERSGQNPPQNAQNYAHAAEPETHEETDSRVRIRGTSDFLAACDGARIEDVLSVLDEHMDVIRVLYPKEYEAIVQKIKELP